MGLPIIEEKSRTRRQVYEDEVRKVWENIPLEKIDPTHSMNSLLRIERTLTLLEGHIKIEGSEVADLGCGTGHLASLLAAKGGEITAVDVVQRIHPTFTFVRACLPYLSLSDSSFDGVVLTDVIAEIEPHLYRLTLSELARILKKEGWLICSTQLDIHSHDAQERFVDLIKTEFEIFDSKKSYHRLHYHLTCWVKAPYRFIRGGKEEAYRLNLLQKRSGPMRLWFYLNSHRMLSLLWKPIAWIFTPFLHLLQTNRKFLLFCENISEILWGSGALTHLIILARKKKM